MINVDLPVILLKKIVLLPNNELRLEFDTEISKNIITKSLLHHNNKVFVVTQIDALEEEPSIDDLPLSGVIAKITNRLELPNGKTRVIITGLSRAIVSDYNYEKTGFNAIVSELTPSMVEDEIDIAMGRKLKKEMEHYIKVVPYISNSVISQIEDAQNLDCMTDIIVNYLQLSVERKLQYISCPDPLKRTKMILEDIYKDEESFEIEKKLDYLVKEEIDKNQKEYILKEKLQLIKAELGDINLKDSEIFELRKRIAKLVAPKEVKEKLNYELDRYAALPSTSSELGMVREYIECLLSLPWSIKTEDNNDLNDIKNKLDLSHYGLNDVKERIIEYLAVRKISNNVKSPIICLIGPPGVGKTTLAHSIANSLNRKFIKISVGGMNDEAEIRGHRRTYIGAYPGRIIDSLKKTQSSNPVILIDEIDKIGNGRQGDPSSALLEVLDRFQNKHFHDNYVDLDYDLSEVMFILTANNQENIPEALLDRLEIIKLSEYTEYEKCDIAKRHIVPNLCLEHNLNSIVVDNKVLINIIRNYTKEAGVRELERTLTMMVRKIVTKMVLKDQYTDKIKLREKDVDKYLGKSKFKSIPNQYNQVGVVSALSYTPFGGEILPIEVNYYSGKGNLILTGSLGKIMQESATIALSYIKASAKEFDIDYRKLINNDIHIHVPSGAISKDGPSAGVTLATSIISAFKEINFDSNIAMTGELTLRGRILPVGGLKEKCIGAIKNNIKKIFVPIGNMADIDAIPSEIKNKLEFIFVDDYKDIYDNLMEGMKK